MKVIAVLLLIVAAVYAAPEKRIIKDTFSSIWDAIKDVWNAAEDEFNRLKSGIDINLDTVVNALIPLIDSATTEAACTAICVGSAGYVLGPAASLAGPLCGPACKAALAKLEQMAG